MSTTLQERLRARIRQLGMNVADVASLAGVNRSFLYDIIRGRSQTPNLERLKSVAAVVKVDVETDRETSRAKPRWMRGRSPTSLGLPTSMPALQWAAAPSLRKRQSPGVISTSAEPGSRIA